MRVLHRRARGVPERLTAALDDIVVNPKDGALYFAIGGRSTMSGLYRVTYVGKESTVPASKRAWSMRVHCSEPSVRASKLSIGKKDAKAVETAWPYLSNPDRFLRYAARTVLEFQDPATWQDKAWLRNTQSRSRMPLIGLARAGDKSLQPKMLEALQRVDWSKLTDAEKIDYLRAYQLAFIRIGMPDASQGIASPSGSTPGIRPSRAR